MINTKFKGTGVALITPFKADLSIDFNGITRIVEHVIKGEVEFLVPLGSTGESATLSEDEARQVLDHVIKINQGRKPILAGNFGDNNTARLTQKIASYNFDGIDGILSSSPAYVKPSQEGIYQHYMAINDVSPVPIIIYNVPSRTQSNIEFDTCLKLANASEKFIAVKEASGDLIQVTKLVKNKPDNFLILSGDDENTLPHMGCGGDGVISVIANALPRDFSDMIRSALEGDYKSAQKLNFKTYDLHKWLYAEGNPVGIKTAMQVLGLCENHVRLPLTNMSKSGYAELEKVLKTIT